MQDKSLVCRTLSRHFKVFKNWLEFICRLQENLQNALFGLLLFLIQVIDFLKNILDCR